MNIPCIALADADSPLQYVDIAIPANNKGRESIAIMFYFLARETLMLKGEIPRNADWDIMVDLFMHREFYDKKKVGGEDEFEEDIVVEEQVDDVTNTLNKFKDGAEADAEEEEEEGDEDAQNWAQ